MANKPTGNPNGRPTKYDAKITPGIVRKLAEAGMTDEDMADVLEIGIRTLYDWKEAHPEFSQAIADGKANPIKDVEDALLRLSKGYTYEEGGQKKVKHPDVRAIQFYLKNVAGDKWKEKSEVDQKTSMTFSFDKARAPEEQDD